MSAAEAPPVPQDAILSPDAVMAPLRRARASQGLWGAFPVARRVAHLAAARGLAAARATALARASATPRGAPVGEALVAEVLPLLEAIRFLEREAPRLLAPERRGGRGRPLWLSGTTLEVRREPLGVVLVIGPANYPLFIPGVQALQALAAGNAVLWKPAPGGAEAARALAAILGEAGLPADLLAVLPEGREAAEAAIEAGVDHVLLTGSAATGEAVLKACAPRLTPAALELSGCDPVLVRADADLARAAAAIAYGMTLNGGATCIAPRRILVARERAAELEALLAAALARALPRPVSAAVGARATRLMAEALEHGGRLVAGRIPADASAMSPSIVADPPEGSRLLREELFAPLAALVRTSSDEHALALAALSPLALGASIFTADERAARALSGRVRAGVVVVNDVVVPTADPRVPFGGRGRSGAGVTRGPEGLLALTATKAVLVRRGRARHLEPARPGDEGLFQAYIEAAHGRGLRARAGAAGRLAGALWRRIFRQDQDMQAEARRTW